LKVHTINKGDKFITHWKKFMEKKADSAEMDLLAKSLKPNGINFTDLLICSNKKEILGIKQLKSYNTDNLFNQIIYKNILHSLDVDIRKLSETTKVLYWIDPSTLNEYMIFNVNYTIMFVDATTMDCVKCFIYID
jgi:hypothetical protein